MDADDCQYRFPGSDVWCSSKQHPHRTPHFASGTRGGQRFALYWWDPTAALDQPEDRADGRPWVGETDDRPRTPR